MRGTWPRPSSAISRSSHPSTFPSIDPSSTPSFTSSRPLPPTRSTRSSPSSTFRPAISSKPQPEKPLSGLANAEGDTSHGRSSSATAPRLPDAGRFDSFLPPVGREISRFPVKERPHMPGSWTSPDRPRARANAPVRVAFRGGKRVGVRDYRTFAAQWLACTIPCRRFADTLAGAAARLGADVDRYSFIVVDSHHLLLASLPAHSHGSCCSHRQARQLPTGPGGGLL